MYVRLIIFSFLIILLVVKLRSRKNEQVAATQPWLTKSLFSSLRITLWDFHILFCRLCFYIYWFCSLFTKYFFCDIRHLSCRGNRRSIKNTYGRMNPYPLGHSTEINQMWCLQMTMMKKILTGNIIYFVSYSVK